MHDAPRSCTRPVFHSSGKSKEIKDTSRLNDMLKKHSAESRSSNRWGKKKQTKRREQRRSECVLPSLTNAGRINRKHRVPIEKPLPPRNTRGRATPPFSARRGAPDPRARRALKGREMIGLASSRARRQ